MHVGGCTCGEIRYRLASGPLFFHACHCTWCQRETGSAFVLNALIETDRIGILSGTPMMIDTPSNSGKGQRIARCPRCHVALWSHYSGAGPKLAFVRVGTLEGPGAMPPDIHIFTTTKLPWLDLPQGAVAVPEYYRRDDYWPADSLARRRTMLDG